MNIECPICKQNANLLYTEEYEYIFCENCKIKIMPSEQIKIIGIEKETGKDIREIWKKI
jgi:DNA-directed RNA polymerase subunit RPC12/RpoP